MKLKPFLFYYYKNSETYFYVYNDKHVRVIIEHRQYHDRHKFDFEDFNSLETFNISRYCSIKNLVNINNNDIPEHVQRAFITDIFKDSEFESIKI
jgi:hypothetical protein